MAILEGCDGDCVPRVGVYALTSCYGCQLKLATVQKIMEIANAVSFESFYMLSSKSKHAPDVNVAFVEGSVSTEKDLEELFEIRKHSRILVALGACSVNGGVQSWSENEMNHEQLHATVYGNNKIGMKGLVKEYKVLLQKELTPEHKEFIESLILSCETARDFNKRYADKARTLADATTDTQRKKELHEIARICEKVPWNPPETFWEALQSLWTTHMLVMAAESYPGAGLSHGRWDQYMYPFYKASIESGEISPEMAKELLQTYWIKHNYVYDFQGRLGLNQGRRPPRPSLSLTSVALYCKCFAAFWQNFFCRPRGKRIDSPRGRFFDFLLGGTRRVGPGRVTPKTSGGPA